MADSNRARISYVKETTIGTTPAISGTTEMRTGRFTGESLNFAISNVVSDEIRNDRQINDIIQVSAQCAGDLNFEASYPLYRTFHEEFMAAALFAAWTNLPTKHNITADSELANVGSGTGVYTVDSGGASFIATQLVRASGFTNTANNGIFTVSSNTSTTITTSNSGSVAETAPPAGARLKVVGVQGGSGDFVADVTGGNHITCTAVSFITLGFTVGMWIKIGDSSNAAYSFATAGCNTWARVTAVTATQLTLDNIPSGVTFGADSGTSKTIRIWMADTIKNGTTMQGFTIEKAFLDQNTPTYETFLGCVPGAMSLALNASQLITGSYTMLGLTHATSTSSLGSPAAASTEDVLSAAANVARLAENDTDQASPDLVNQLTINLNNNLRLQQAIGTLGGVGIGSGRCELSGNLNGYFGSKTRYDKYVNGTDTSLNFRITRALTSGNRAIIVSLPSIEFESGSTPIPGPNQDVFAQLGWRAKRNSTYDAQIMVSKFDYWN